MYQTARKEKKKMTGGLLMTAAVCCILTGVTEPMEFSFMFLAPGLFFSACVFDRYLRFYLRNAAVSDWI